ncbi:hypothetical protein BDV33DRAFT_185951 [Aspergillus novoparasiticus]|uniref:F-box domain-containing protein n=1 Tax=Aspergillus novoparasiticus TaxID=986946 RepID=A0A5N6E6J7_9EURO|nr:hypothetical protein BDV33DRAFT_185951 [Aspergillus novoparasiticus]
MPSLHAVLPTEVVLRIIQGLEPFEALRLSYTCRRLFSTIRALHSYWRSYYFQSAKEFIRKRQGDPTGLIQHLVERPGPCIDVTMLRSLLHLVQSEAIWYTLEHRELICGVRDPYRSLAVWQRSSGVIIRTISQSLSVAAFDCVREGLQLLRDIAVVSGMPVVDQQWLKPIQETLSHAAYAGAYLIFADGFSLLQDIEKFGQTIHTLQYVVCRSGHQFEDTRLIPLIRRSISQAISIGAWDSVNTGCEILHYLSENPD